MNSNWLSAFETTVDAEAQLVAVQLKDAGIPAVVMNRHDKSIDITFFNPKSIHVLVQPERLEEAQALLAQAPLSEEDLEKAALNATPPIQPNGSTPNDQSQ